MALKVDKADAGLKTDHFETGTIMPVLDVDGEQKYLHGDKDFPMQVRVRSIRSQAVKACSVRLQKRTAAMNKGNRKQDAQIPNHEFIARQASAAAMELINFDKTERVQTGTEDEFYDILKDVAMEDLANQIWAHAEDDKKFADGAKTEGNISGGTAAIAGSQA